MSTFESTCLHFIIVKLSKCILIWYVSTFSVTKINFYHQYHFVTKVSVTKIIFHYRYRCVTTYLCEKILCKKWWQAYPSPKFFICHQWLNRHQLIYTASPFDVILKVTLKYCHLSHLRIDKIIGGVSPLALFTKLSYSNI